MGSAGIRVERLESRVHRSGFRVREKKAQIQPGFAFDGGPKVKRFGFGETAAPRLM